MQAGNAMNERVTDTPRTNEFIGNLVRSGQYKHGDPIIASVDAFGSNMERELAEARARQAIPEGYVVVPREPPPKLIAAMCNSKTGAKVLALDYEEAIELYRAMIAAALRIEGEP
jgi:hypothetical protein